MSTHKKIGQNKKKWLLSSKNTIFLSNFYWRSRITVTFKLETTSTSPGYQRQLSSAFSERYVYFVIIKADNHNIHYVNYHHCLLNLGPEKYDEKQPHWSPRQVFSEFSKLDLHITYRPITCKKLDWYKLLGLLGDLVYKAQKGMLIKEAAWWEVTLTADLGVR